MNGDASIPVFGDTHFYTVLGRTPWPEVPVPGTLGEVSDFVQNICEIREARRRAHGAPMLALFTFAALLNGAASLRVVASRTSSISMGLAVGEKFPATALSAMGVSGKKACIFFYGADDAPSCSKELKAFDAAGKNFTTAGVAVVGVRNPAGAKGTDVGVKLFVDEGDAIRTEIGIQKDLFGLLGGRETYVVDASGTVASVFNSQFSPEEHVKTALAAVKELPADKNPLEDFLGKLGLKF